MSMSGSAYFLFDTHAHSDAFTALEWEHVSQSAKAHGVVGNLSAGVWWDQFLKLKSDYSRWILPRTQNAEGLRSSCAASNDYLVLPALGLHPMEIATRWKDSLGGFDKKKAMEDVEQFCAMAEHHTELIWAIGETGFDASADVKKDWINKTLLLEAQTFAFGASVDLAVRFNRPLIIHSRSAWQHTVEALKQAFERGLKRFMIHCYSGPAGDLAWVAQNGGFASFGGVLTWPTAKKVQQACVQCPASALLLETDSPDLSPVLADGLRPVHNEPRFLREVSFKAAELRDQSVEDVTQLSFENFLRFLF